MNVRKKNLGSAFKRVLTGVLCLALVLSMVPAVLATEAESGLFDLNGSSMTLGNTLEINFAIDTAYLEADGNYAVISKEYADARGTVTKTVPQSQWKLLSGTVEYFSYAVSAKEMNDKLTVTVYNAGGEQLSNTYEDSVAGYCLRMLGKEEEKAAPNKQIMSLLVDMLNYGAAAQAEWSYNTDALANAGLSETQKGYATVPGEANSCLEKGTGYYGTSLSLKENLLMNFAYYADQIQDAAYAEVTFIDHYGNDESETIQAKDFKTYDAQVKYIEITSMAVADCRKSVTVTLYDAEGNALSTTVDSAESYISRMSGDINDAILAFSDGAHNYFHSEDADPGQGENTTVISGNVSTEDGKVAEDAAFADGDVSAQVPAGVQVDGDTLTLTITEKNTSDSGVELEEGQQILPLDIHIDGVSEENATPIQVCLGKILPNGLNIGNVTLYHVEDGVANEMTQVMTLAELDAHNEFYYDPATGDITVAMASFSEVAMVSTESEWTGGVDHTWYTDPKNGEYVIANADQLWSLSQIVGGMAKDEDDNYIYTATNSDGEESHYYDFAGKTIKLIADINLADDEDNNDSNKIFYPIGYYNSEGTYGKTGTAITSGLRNFKGTFDGQGHTISNFYQNTWEMKGDHDWYAATEQNYRDGMGLFGRIYGGTVKNLTVKNFSSDGEIATTGTIAAYAEGATFENIAIFNCNPRVYNIGNGGIVGCVGWYAKEATLKTTFTNITVDNSNKISALWGSYDVACGGLVGQYYPTSGQSSASYPANGGIHMENCHVAAQMDVYNDVCANYQYYAYRYAGMLIGSIRENETIDGHVYPKMDGITANDCTVHFGDWNDYYYCELVANSLASYTHDHQMSRLEQVEAVDVENMTVTPLEGEATAIPTSGRVNYVVVKSKDANGMWIHGDGHNYAECYHFVDGTVWNHADAGTETVDGEIVLKEDKQLIYREFNQLFTGYGWGVTSKGLTDYEGVENMDIQLGDHDESVVKFNSIAQESYPTGTTVTISELFTYNDACGVALKPENIQVAVTDLNESGVSAVFTKEDNWKNSTLTFSGTGSLRITIQDYYFCEPTEITVQIAGAEKFTAKSVDTQSAYTQITLGDLFDAKDGATIGNVTATVTTSDGNSTITGTSSDWATKTIDLVKDGTYTVEIKDDDATCSITTATFTVEKTDKFTKLFNKNFLYRVGNNDTVPVGKVFDEIETPVALSAVNVAIENEKGDAAGTFTSSAAWTEGTMEFTGTGVVKVTISADGANDASLYLEVVNATNLTSAKGTTTGGNFVLLCDVSTSSYMYYWNSTLYGNGFTYSLAGAPTTYSSSHGHGVIITKNATLDNLVIVGDVYDEYGAYTSNNDYNAAIDILGETVIENCYISGCSAPISARANVTISDTTLYGGAVANLLIKGGTVTLENVTTVNYNDGRHDDGDPVGMGIVIHSDASETAKLILNGTLTQYNFLNEEDTPTDTYAKNLHSAMFGDTLSQYHFTEGSYRRVNTGIISMTATFNGEDITDNANTGYSGSSVTLSGVNGYVYTQLNTSGTVNNGYDITTDSHVSTIQGAVPPSYNFDHTVNYVAKADDSNDYCYEENGTVHISMDEGDVFNWNTSILTATKAGQTLAYTVSMNGTDYTGKSIVFNTAGSYEIVYTYADANNYGYDADGNLTTYEETYTKTVSISVAVIEAAAKNAEFTMGSSNAATEKITINNTTYISATGVTADNSTWTYITIDDQKIYYPIVAAKLTSTKGSSTYAYFPVFENVVTITDYADNGTGDAFTYNSSTTSASHTALPTAVKGVYKAASDVPYWYNLTNSNLTQSGASQIFKWASSSDAPSDPTTYNNVLCYKSPQISADRVAYITLVQYSYTDATNTTYYYYVGYTLEAFTKQTTCVTPDTLVTLTDGSQKRIDQVTHEDQLLVWNFYTGKYDAMPASIIKNHGYGKHTIVTLTFEDGATINTIDGHGFFDVETNEYVILGESNVANYIGHSFIKQNNEGYSTTKLISYSITEEYTESWSILTAKHYNAILEGMFTLTPAEVEGSPNYLMPFEIGEGMKYDEVKMQADIEKYGLYTYEDFDEYMTYEQFAALDLAIFKVSVGKGYITWDDIMFLVYLHIPQ